MASRNVLELQEQDDKEVEDEGGDARSGRRRENGQCEENKKYKAFFFISVLLKSEIFKFLILYLMY